MSQVDNKQIAALFSYIRQLLDIKYPQQLVVDADNGQYYKLSYFQPVHPSIKIWNLKEANSDLILKVE